MGAKYKRSVNNFLTGNPFQLRAILICIAYLLTVIILVAAILFYPSIHNLLSDQQIEQRYLEAQLFLFMLKRLLLVLPVLFFFLMHLVVLTHRICGPLVNITNTLKKIADGDLSARVTIRRRDFLHKEVKALNSMVGSVTARLLFLGKQKDTLLGLLDDIKASTDDQAVLGKIQTVLAKMNEQQLK